MSATVEVVMPNSEDRKSFLRGFPTAARVVSMPSQRTNVDRIVVAGLESFENMSGVELISRIRESQKNFSVVFFVASNSKKSPKEIILFQNIAIASSKRAEPAFVAPDEDTVARIVRAHLASAEKALIATARIENDQLWVWSCEPKLYRCQISLLPPWRASPPHRSPSLKSARAVAAFIGPTSTSTSHLSPSGPLLIRLYELHRGGSTGKRPRPTPTPFDC